MMEQDILKAIRLARHAASFGMTRGEVAETLREAGYSVETTFFAMAGMNVLGRDYVCVPQRGNRAESCVQVLSA